MDASPDSSDTDAEWLRILDGCARKAAIGFGLLDSFLSGPDIERRVALVEAEAGNNPWLRLELRDALTMDQSASWSALHTARLARAANGLAAQGC